MNIRKLLMPLAACILAQALAANAELYLANVRGTCKAVNERDRLASKPFNNKTILEEFAALQDPVPDIRDLNLVYDTEEDRIAIANDSGEILGDVYTFGFPIVISNSAETQQERHAFLFQPGSADAAGNVVLTERLTRDAENTVIKQSTRGRFTYANAATEEAVAEICTGSFTTSRKLVIETPAP
jgi:hypothetical protein